MDYLTNITRKIKQTFKSHIVYRIFFTYIILIATTLSIVTIIYYYFSSSSLLRQNQQNMEELNLQIMLNLDKMVESMEKASFLVNYEDDLNSLMKMDSSNSAIFGTPAYISVDNYFFNLLYSFSEIHGVYIYSANGCNVLARSKDIATSTPKNVSDEIWFQETLELNGRKKVSGKHFNASGKTEVFSLARAICNFDNNKIIGVIVLEQDISEIQKILNEISSQPDSNILLLDNNQQIIYSSNDQLYETLSANNLFQTNFSKEGALYYKIANFVISQTTSEITGWKLLSVQSEQELTASIRSIPEFFPYILIFSLLITFILSLYLSRKMTVNLKKMRTMMDEIDRGNLNVRIKVDGSDEIAVIANSCNTMLDKIKYLTEKKYEEKLLRKDAELKMLQAQINPHFLYNTLGFIKFSAQENNDQETADMIQCLARLLRYNLGKGERIVTLENEVNNAKDYLTLQKQRFQDNLEVQFHIDKQILNTRIPSMTFQPILENAFIHGFENKLGDYRLYIECLRKNDDIHIVIKDNGEGIPPEKLDIINRDLALLTEEAEQSGNMIKDKIGIYNVHMRIIYCFGKNYGISLQSAPSDGLTVNILLPYEKEDVNHVKNTDCR